MTAGPSTRVACAGPATPGVRRGALGPVRSGIRGRFLLLALSLLWPTQAWAQVTPPPAPTTGEIVEYYATDALGSIRVVFTAAGAEVARADYLPFGERFHTTGPLPSQQFTGQQRDPEAQLDHSNARSYQTTTGRFTGIDLVYSGMFDPQQWNRYAYARNNPLRYVDPSGLVAQALTCKDMRIDGVTYNICDSVTVVGDGGGGGGGGGGSGSGIPGRSFPDPGRTGPGGTDEPFASGGIARGGAPPPHEPGRNTEATPKGHSRAP